MCLVRRESWELWARPHREYSIRVEAGVRKKTQVKKAEGSIYPLLRFRASQGRDLFGMALRMLPVTTRKLVERPLWLTVLENMSGLMKPLDRRHGLN